MRPPDIAAVDAAEIENWADTAAHVAVAMDRDPAHTDTRTRQCIWLAAYEASSSLSVACRTAGISEVAVSHWKRDDPVFVQLRALADERINEAIAAEIHRRAVVGVEQGVWHQGKLVGTQIKASDRLLEFLAMRRDPERWGEQRTQQAADDSAARMLRKVLADPKAYALLQEAAAQLALGSGVEDAVILAGEDD